MPGARTIVGDGLSGLVWVLELTSAISSAHCLLAYRRAYLGLITQRSGKGPKMGLQIERAENMHWDGAVLAAERCCAAGWYAILPYACRKMVILQWEPWARRIRIEQD